MEIIEPLVKDVLIFEERAEGIEAELKSAIKKPVEQIDILNLKIKELRDEIERTAEPFREPIEKVAADIEAKKDQIAEILTAAEKKTVELPIAKVQVKTTKSVNILDKPGLVKVLANIKDGIDKGVKTFALPYIKDLMKVDVVTDDIAEFTEKQTVYIKATEPDETGAEQ